MGSSKMSSSGSCMKASTMPTFWRLPLESSFTRRSSAREKRSASSMRTVVGEATSPGEPSDVIAGGHATEQGELAREIPDAAVDGDGVGWASRPSTRAVPAVGRCRSRRARMVVVFPAPLGPRKPKISPGSTRRSRSSTARIDPKTLVRPIVTMAGPPCALGTLSSWESPSTLRRSPSI